MSQGSESTEVLCMEVMEHVHFTLNESVIQAVIRCHSKVSFKESTSVIQAVIQVSFKESSSVETHVAMVCNMYQVTMFHWQTERFNIIG